VNNKTIELAALAAGVSGQWCEFTLLDSGEKRTGIGNPQIWNPNVTLWNPADDDAQALRLAVKLGMMVAISPTSSSARMPCDCRCNAVAYGVDGTTPEERTRHAILLCAAKHGSSMQRAAGGPYCPECENYLCGGTRIFQGSECIGIPF